MANKTITKYLSVNHYKQNDSYWKDYVLTGKDSAGKTITSTIGLSGCAMTSGGMVAGKNPGILYDTYGMKELLCDWTKIPSYNFTRFAISTNADIASKLFKEIVLYDNPIILYGDDGKGGAYSTHFVVAYGFVGTVAVDIDGGYSLTSNDLSQFKVLDPSVVRNYGNHTTASSFNTRFPIQNLRVPSPK